MQKLNNPPKEYEEAYNQLKTIYQDLNVGDAAQKEIEKYHAMALAELSSLSLSGIQKKMLQRYAASLTGRNK